MTTTGPPTISRHGQRRPPLLPKLLVLIARGGRRPHPKTRHPLTPRLRNGERGTQRRCPPTSPLPPNLAYTDGSRCVNRGRQRRQELQLSTLNSNRRTHLTADRRLAQMANRSLLTGLTSRTCALFPNETLPFCTATAPPPPCTNEKEYHKYPGPAAPHDATPPAVPPLPDFPARCVPGRARVCTRPKETGSPTGPVFWPMAL